MISVTDGFREDPCMPSSVLRSVVDKGQGIWSAILFLFNCVLPVQ